jgi:hypothetical protein
MRHVNTFIAVTVFVVITSWPAVPLYGGEPALRPEDLVAQHLASLGSAEARAAAKTRVVQGAAVYKILVGGSGRLDGKTGLVSDGRKVRFMVKLPQNDYKGESVAFNGDSVQVAFSNANQSRSPFSSFVSAQDAILREGLLGGVLSTAWALLDVPDRKPKLEYEGLKKVDGHQLHQLRYWPRKGSDMEIRMYFEPETFHHVKTVYSLSVANNVGATILESANLKAQRTTLEERFSDFKVVDGLSLPTHWNIEFTRELPDGSTSVSQWDMQEDQIRNNIGIDAKNFEVK